MLENIFNNGLLVERDTGNNFFYKESNLNGNNEYVFTTPLIIQIDKAILDNNYKFLSKEQENMLMKYFEEADTQTLNEYNLQLDEALSVYYYVNGE